MFLLRFNLLPLALFLACCQTEPLSEDATPKADPIWKEVVGEPEKASLPESSVSQNLLETIQQANTLEDILVFEKYIHLEETADSYLKEVTRIVRLEAFWFVLDIWEGKVFRYSENGSFAGMVGRPGEGPGEYRRPRNIFRCPLGLAVVDSAKILVFNVHGDLVQTLSGNSGSDMVFQSETVLWQNTDLMILFDYPSLDHSMPWHAILKPRSDGQWAIASRFGQRPKNILQAGDQGGWSWAYTCATLVNDTIWCGSPYDCSLEIYDLKGRLLARPNADHENGLKPTQFTPGVLADRKKLNRIMVTHVANKSLLHHESLVFRMLAQPVGVYYDIFDTRGQALKKKLSGGMGGLTLLDSTNQTLIGVKLSLNGQPPNQLNWRIFSTRTEFENAQKAGLNLETDQGSHFIWTGRIK